MINTVLQAFLAIFLFSVDFSAAHSILDTAADNEEFSSLINLIISTGGDAAAAFLGTDITIFAPVNSALTDIAGLLQFGSAEDILMGHIVQGYYSLSDLMANDCTELNTINNSTIAITTKESTSNEKQLVINGNIMFSSIESIIGDHQNILYGIQEVILPNDSDSTCPETDADSGPSPSDSDGASMTNFAAASIAILCSYVLL